MRAAVPHPSARPAALPVHEPGGGASPGVSVIVPTYREAANVPALVRRVAAVMNGVESWELLLVDDDSADGTVQAVTALARDAPVRVHVRRGVPRDLSLAVVDGFRAARYDRFVVMDADLSHPPEQIPALLAALGRGAIAVGSRYVPGGRLDDDWAWRRRAASWAATALARPLVAAADPMSGFFAVHRSTVAQCGALQPVGYKIGLELMVRGQLDVREVPIAFRDRERGASKMGARTFLAYLRHLGRLYPARFGTPVRLASFLAVGASGFAVDVATYLGLQALGLDHRLARFLSFWPAVTWNWRLNRALTFGDRPRPSPTRQWSRFVATSLAGLAVNVGGYVALTTFVEPFARHRLLALVAGVALGSAVNYLLADGYVYRGRAGR